MHCGTHYDKIMKILDKCVAKWLDDFLQVQQLNVYDLVQVSICS